MIRFRNPISDMGILIENFKKMYIEFSNMDYFDLDNIAKAIKYFIIYWKTDSIMLKYLSSNKVSKNSSILFSKRNKAQWIIYPRYSRICLKSI